MEDFKKRILEEYIEVSNRAVKLEAFLSTDKFKELNKEMQVLMKLQNRYMNGYIECLVQRLELLLTEEQMNAFMTERRIVE